MPKIDMTNIPQKTVHVHRGKPIDLNIPIMGKPQPICSWYFAGVKLKDSLDRIKITSNGKHSHLVIREATINDTGDYTLEVKNAIGVATEIVKVIILGKETFWTQLIVAHVKVHSYQQQCKKDRLIKSEIFTNRLIVSTDKPGIPVGPIRIEEVSGVSVTASWEPPEKDGGANISGYVVEQREAHQPGWSTISESVTRPCFKFTRLSEGTEYVFRVAAMNRFGVGGFLQSQVVECKSPESKYDSKA